MQHSRFETKEFPLLPVLHVCIAVLHMQNFSLVYIELGFHRLVGEKQAELLPLLVNSLSGKSAQQQDRYGGEGGKRRNIIIVIIIFQCPEAVHPFTGSLHFSQGHIEKEGAVRGI